MTLVAFSGSTGRKPAYRAVSTGACFLVASRAIGLELAAGALNADARCEGRWEALTRAPTHRDERQALGTLGAEELFAAGRRAVAEGAVPPWGDTGIAVGTGIRTAGVSCAPRICTRACAGLGSKTACQAGVVWTRQQTRYQPRGGSGR